MKSIYIIKLCFFGLFAIAISSNIYAQSDGFYLGLGLGGGDVSVDNDNFPGSDLLDIGSGTVTAGELSIGYEFQNNLGIDLTAGSYDTFQFIFQTERADLDSLRIGVSYTIPSESKFRAYGRTGLNFWQIDIEESGVFNPGPEERVKQSSQDLFLQLGFEYRFNRRFRMGLAYDYTKTDFGDVDGIKLNFKFFP